MGRMKNNTLKVDHLCAIMQIIYIDLVICKDEFFTVPVVILQFPSVHPGQAIICYFASPFTVDHTIVTVQMAMVNNCATVQVFHALSSQK